MQSSRGLGGSLGLMHFEGTSGVVFLMFRVVLSFRQRETNY